MATQPGLFQATMVCVCCVLIRLPGTTVPEGLMFYYRCFIFYLFHHSVPTVIVAMHCVIIVSINHYLSICLQDL